MEEKRISAYLVSSKDIDYNVILQDFVYNIMSRSQGEWKGERENDKQSILKSMVARGGEIFYRFSI